MSERKKDNSKPGFNRGRILAVASGVVSFATTAAVAATVVVGHGPLLERAAELKKSELKVAFEWPPLAGKKTSRTASGEPATWLNAEQRRALEQIALTLLSGNPFDRAGMDRAQKALRETGWFTDGPWLRRHEDGLVVIAGRWRTPSAAVRTQAGDRLVSATGEPLPILYPVARSGMKVISGVSMPEPAPGEKWTGGEVQAGLELLNFLRPMPGFEQVASVDVSEFAAHKRLSILTVTGGKIVWGAPPTKSGFAPGQAPPELKRERLAAVFRQFGQLDAGRPVLDVRSEDGVYTLDTTGVMTEDPAKGKKADAKSKSAAKNRR
jgi:hypothetical protein